MCPLCPRRGHEQQALLGLPQAGRPTLNNRGLDLALDLDLRPRPGGRGRNKAGQARPGGPGPSPPAGPGGCSGPRRGGPASAPRPLIGHQGAATQGMARAAPPHRGHPQTGPGRRRGLYRALRPTPGGGGTTTGRGTTHARRHQSKSEQQLKFCGFWGPPLWPPDYTKFTVLFKTRKTARENAGPAPVVSCPSGRGTLQVRTTSGRGGGDRAGAVPRKATARRPPQATGPHSPPCRVVASRRGGGRST